MPACCPPSYDIFAKFTHWYASALTTSFRQLTKRNLKNSEIIPLLSWLKSYKSEEMMMHPDLKVGLKTFSAWGLNRCFSTKGGRNEHHHPHHRCHCHLHQNYYLCPLSIGISAVTAIVHLMDAIQRLYRFPPIKR